MKRFAQALCLLLAATLLLAGCGGAASSSDAPSQAASSTSAATPPPAPPLDDARVEELHALAAQFTAGLQAGDEAGVFAMMDGPLQEALKGQLILGWQQIAAGNGGFEETGVYMAEESGGYQALEMMLLFKAGSMVQRTVFDGENRITGLRFYAGVVDISGQFAQPLPEDLTETPVVVDAGEGYPLDGMLITPAGEGPFPAVVLVHGSGAQDMDSSAGANKPLRDIAIGLAQRGIATLRYNKRTYSYGTEIAAAADYDKFTVDEEICQDAAAAVKLLQTRPEVNADQVFLMGHSQSGGLLAYTAATYEADVAGFVILAGTPRQLWEVSAEQTLRSADELEGNGEAAMAAQLRANVQAEVAKAETLPTMTDEQALAGTVMGLSGWHQRALARIDAVALYNAAALPTLVLQGGRDRQVSQTDYDLWQQGLGGYASFHWYPTLNHLLGEYQGEEVPYSRLVAVEYTQYTPVSPQLLDDTAAWVLQVAR